MYAFDGATGGLRETGRAAASGAERTAFHPNGKFVYAATTGGKVEAYRLEVTSGAITKIGSAACDPSNGCMDVAVTPDGAFAYATSGVRVPGFMSSYTIDGNTGQLTFTERQSTRGEQARNVAIHPDGAQVFVVHHNTGQIVSWKVQKATGKLQHHFTHHPNPKAIMWWAAVRLLP